MSGPISLDGKVAIVGASLAGLRAAETLRREGFAGEITMIGEERWHPYDRPPLSKQVLNGTWPIEKVDLADDEKLGGLGLNLMLGVRATRLDAEAKRLFLIDGDDFQYDGIVLATGCHLRRLPGTESMPGVFGLRTKDDAMILHQAMADLDPGSRVVLIGAGFIGQEVATAAVNAGHHVTILEGLARPLLPIVGEEVAGLLQGMVEASGATLRTGVKVTGIGAPGNGAAGGWVNVEGGEDVPADLIVVGIGVIPTTEWLEDSGLHLENGIVTDRHLFAGPGIVAAGDVARFHWHDAGHDELVRIEHWQMAVDHGVHAAKSLLAGSTNAEVFSAVPYFWSDVWGKKIQVLGHPSANDEVEIVSAPDGEGRFIALYHQGDFFTAVLAVSKPRQLMAFRPLLAAGSTMADARAIEL
jgi:NADPH-dependent 2,4-dienoyl-CoA reductase/sulfur reductase-like enzyme